jgi:hypothetical protein
MGQQQDKAASLSVAPPSSLSITAFGEVGNDRLLYRGIRQEQSYFISLFLPCLGRRWQMTSQGLVLLFEVGTWPPHDGFRRMGWFNLWSALADDGREGLRSLRTHLTRRPREDTFLPEQNSLNLLSVLPTVHAA